MKLPIGRVLPIGMLLCGGLFVWAAATGLKAKQCLEGQLHPDFNGATITGRGCEVTTTSGETLVVAISGPPFEAGVAGALGFVVLGMATVVMLVRRARRWSVDQR
ncbi:hypothetical protein [Streptomyces sp. A012304]|uniref:hypothetical protein n=1 Tax=Streptomyces sp. A012304 TaxID=375446 RepID=UPI00223005AA|nr:hypothetical protein [Streptomyces sp. A012304]GKQ41774.1 hypothetical protein ALMP_82870 [Streptomyces sp. A012304]